MVYLVRTLLHFCQIRGLAWEPRNGIHFLCQHYGDQLQSIRNQLNLDSIERNFLRTVFVSQLPFQEQRRCYRTLLGREPPSTTPLAPPATEGNHTQSQSASGPPRAQGISRASLPDFLCPPGSQKVKSSQSRTTHTTSTLMEHTGLSLHTTRDSRSRYRVSSTPSSRHTSPTNPQLGSNPQVQLPNIVHSTNQASVPSQHGRAVSYSTPNILAPRQQCTNMRAGVSGLRAAGPPAKSTPIADLLPLDTRTTYQIPRKSPPQASGTLIPEQRPSRLHIVKPDGEAVSRTMYNIESKEETHNLHLVGPQGVYQTSLTSRNPLPATSEATNVSQNPPLIFELDTTPPHNTILAELSADIDAALQVSNHPCTSPPPALPQSYDLYRPSVPRTQSAPLSTLPASLSVGNAPPLLPSTPPHHTPFAGSTTQTNASRYSKQYSPPFFAQVPNGVPASPPFTPAPLSVYKAYQPTIVPTSGQAYPISPPDSAGAEDRIRPTSFAQVKDVDGMGHYFAIHNRQASQAVQEVSGCLDSSKLAMEYRAALPDFDEGYGGR